MARFALSLACLLAVVARSGVAQTVGYNVVFDDPGGAYSPYYTAITSHIQAAGAVWGQRLTAATNVTATVQVGFPTSIGTGNGTSVTSTFVRFDGGVSVYEQGLATFYRTGGDTNGLGSPDVRFNFNPTYLQSNLWFDPNPTARTAAVPNNRTDAMSVMLHELGHALGFNGWRDYTTGQLPGDYKSTFDALVTVGPDGTPQFNGATAKAAYHANGTDPVPLTYGNIMHLDNGVSGTGEPNGRPGNDLVPDLMNGSVFYNGQRYFISELDLAVLKDTGFLIVPVLEPATVGVVAVAALVVVRRRRAA